MLDGTIIPFLLLLWESRNVTRKASVNANILPTSKSCTENCTESTAVLVAAAVVSSGSTVPQQQHVDDRGSVVASLFVLVEVWRGSTGDNNSSSSENTRRWGICKLVGRCRGEG